MKITEIIHRLEDENQNIARLLPIYDYPTYDNYFEINLFKYDFNQSIIDILERIDEEKITELIEDTGHRVCTSDGFENTYLKTVITKDTAKSIKQYLEGTNGTKKD